ncbi:MAG: ABC transporter ATP-binding protein [Ferruginibacter sp.]
MKIFWTYLKPYRWLVLLSLILAAVAQMLTLFDPVIFGKIIDDYALNPNGKSETELVNGVLFWLAVATGIAILARLAKSFQEYLLRLVVQKFGMQLFNDGVRQTLRLSYQEYEMQRSGETVSNLQKVRTDIERFLNAFVNIIFSSVVGICFLIWYAVTTHWALIPVFVIGVLVLGGLTGLLSRKIKSTQRTINRETARLAGTITESLRNIELVKSLGLTYPEIRRMREYTQKIYDLEMIKTKKVRLLSFLQGSTLNILKQSILFILLWLIFRKLLSPGQLISMQVIINTIFGPLQDLGNIILTYREAEAALMNFDDLMKKPVEQRPEDSTEIGELAAIRFSDVIFRHLTATQNAIDGISFEAKTGDTIAFVGPSGSGKSTLIKLLVGLYIPVSGNIYLNGISVREIRYNKARRQIGFVTQDTQLFAGTVRQNLLFAKADATEAEMMEALEKSSALHIISRSGKGLDTILGEAGMRLSGGEKQRLSVARALLRNPRLLIFDEATSALDSITEKEIAETIQSVSSQRKQIIIQIAHRLSTIMHVDIIYVLEKGKIVERGSHNDLLELKGLYYAMWRQQIGERSGRPLVSQ